MESRIEASLSFQLKAAGYPLPEREHLFHPGRRWRFDFAWPSQMLAVEVEGATWAGGRHTRGAGFERDCQKYNAAALAGWRVLRFTRGMIESGEAISVIGEGLGIDL